MLSGFEPGLVLNYILVGCPCCMFLFQAQFFLNSFNLPSNRFYDEAEEENATYLKGSCHGLPTSKQRNVQARYMSIGIVA